VGITIPIWNEQRKKEEEEEKVSVRKPVEDLKLRMGKAIPREKTLRTKRPEERGNNQYIEENKVGWGKRWRKKEKEQG